MKLNETPLHFLERILNYCEIYLSFLYSISMIQDTIIGFLANPSNQEMVDFYIKNRPEVQKEIEVTRKNIEVMKREIEREKASPSDPKLIFRLKQWLGHS